MSEKSVRARLFPDSNVLTGGIVARRGLDRAVLSLCAAPPNLHPSSMKRHLRDASTAIKAAISLHPSRKQDHA